MLSREQVRSLNEAGLIEFLAGEPTEGHQLDFKSALSGETKESQRLELLKDVSSFANAHGGVILVGVEEPDGETPPRDLVVGLADGVAQAKELERVCSSSIVPAVPGLFFQIVRMSEAEPVLAIYVPASLERPHMVSFRKHRVFQVRHSESAQPMTPFEIRDAVLSDASYQGRAREYGEQRVLRFSDARPEDPLLILQAIPLGDGLSRLDVGDPSVRRELTSSGAQGVHDSNDVGISGSFVPTINGVEWPVSDNPSVVVEVHHSGYVELRSGLHRRDSGNELSWVGRYLHYGDADRMRAFGALCQRVVNASSRDSQYLMRCQLLVAHRANFAIRPKLDQLRKFAGPEPTLEWPEQVRKVGESFDSVTDAWGRQLRNAFGLESEGL